MKVQVMATDCPLPSPAPSLGSSVYPGSLPARQSMASAVHVFCSVKTRLRRGAVKCATPKSQWLVEREKEGVSVPEGLQVAEEHGEEEMVARAGVPEGLALVLALEEVEAQGELEKDPDDVLQEEAE